MSCFIEEWTRLLNERMQVRLQLNQWLVHYRNLRCDARAWNGLTLPQRDHAVLHVGVLTTVHEENEAAITQLQGEISFWKWLLEENPEFQ